MAGRQIYGAHNIGAITRRVLKAYDSASAAQRAAGTLWYRKARAECEALASTFGLPVENVAGAMAVLSPQLTWAKNVEGARIACALHHAELRPTKLAGVPAYPANVAKAFRALDGDLTAVAGPKISAFYGAIIGDLSHVVIDIWAARAGRPAGRARALAYCKDEAPGAVEYRALAEGYRRAALRRGIEPAVMQAAVWVTIRESAEWAPVRSLPTTARRRLYRRRETLRTKLGLRPAADLT